MMTALSKYNASVAEFGAESEPIERLHQFLSYALSGEDWLDVEPFLNALPIAENNNLIEIGRISSCGYFINRREVKYITPETRVYVDFDMDEEVEL